MEKICKIVYFDEDSVTDYVQIVAGGELENTTELLKSRDAQEAQSVQANGKVGISGIFKALLGWEAGASADVSAGLSFNSSKMVKNIVKNTILTDFLKTIEDVSQGRTNSRLPKGTIKQFKGYKISAVEDSLSYMVMVSPYLSMLKSGSSIPAGEFNIAVDKLDNALRHAKGYYEFVGTKGRSRVILRFNINSFRNSYTISDLLKMDLSIYAFRQFLSIIQNDPSAARMIGNEENFDLVKTLLRLITQTESLESLKKSLMELQDDNLQHLTTTLNIEKLQRVATLMADNLDNNSEEFWQTTAFKENQWVLAQIFACPCTIFSDKAYVGGKGVDNSGGNLCDFIYQNRLSQNVALIEIKTPCTEIIGNSYRGTYSFSHELSGAVNQVLNYRDNLTKSYYTICHQSASQFEVLSPKCVVIIGKLASMNSTQIAAFESFRNSLSGVQILTFDELYQRVIDLIAILSETPSPTQHTPELEDEGDEFPF